MREYTYIYIYIWALRLIPTQQFTLFETIRRGGAPCFYLFFLYRRSVGLRPTLKICAKRIFWFRLSRKRCRNRGRHRSGWFRKVWIVVSVFIGALIYMQACVQTSIYHVHVYNCASIQVCICTYIQRYIYTSIRLCIHTLMHLYIYTNVQWYIHTLYVYMCIYRIIQQDIYIYVCVCLCLCLCLCLCCCAC